MIKDKKILENIQHTLNLIKSSFNLKNINVRFEPSLLINAMKNGDWVLLDDIHFAPHQVERLMSLLEEEPTLNIYENEPTMYFKKGDNKDNAKNPDENIVNIHSRFRLFMVSSNNNIISSAVHLDVLILNSNNNEKDYAIILSNHLLNSGLDNDYIIQISCKIGKAFYNLLKKEENKNYILKNYILTHTNLINLAKLIISRVNKLDELVENVYIYFLWF